MALWSWVRRCRTLVVAQVTMAVFCRALPKEKARCHGSLPAKSLFIVELHMHRNRAAIHRDIPR